MTAAAELVLVGRHDARLLLRHGVVAAIALVTLVWAGLLAAVPTDLVTRLLGPVLYLDAAIVGLVFVGGAVLVERRQGSLEALAVSPLRPSSYAAGKVATLTGLAVVATVTIAITAAPTIRPGPLLLGVVLLSPPVLLVALAVAARAVTLPGYLLGVQAPLTPAVLPLLASAGWVPTWVAWVSPTMGPFRLLEAGVGGPSLRSWEWALAVVLPSVASILLWNLAVRRVRLDLLRVGRLT